ncbi:MAG: hypothetical protein AMXMBFR13_43890 [Phycisphaerae bacterium]
MSMSDTRYWRSLEEYAATADATATVNAATTPESYAWAQREFPWLAEELGRSDAAGVSRRRLLQMMGATLAMAGMAGCRREEYRILPYGSKPPEIVPGKALYYATTLVIAGRPIGVLAETHEGRPTKLEGNPKHPASGGALPAFAQAAILDLYDPDRSRFVVHEGRPARWEEDFLPAFDALAARLRESRGTGLAILSEADASPAMRLLREHAAKTLPEASFHTYEPLDGSWPDSSGMASASYDLSAADVILSLDCDLLGLEDDGVRHQRAFSAGRNVAKPGDRMNRLYVVEPHWTVTGIAADHRLRLPASGIAALAAALAAELRGGSPPSPRHDGDLPDAWIKAVAEDLKAHRGRCLVVAGRRQPPVVQAMARRLNRELGNVGHTVRYARADASTGTLAELAERMRDGTVSTLLILGGNPVYDAPADLAFAALLKQVAVSIHLSFYHNETSAACRWHVPAAHDLERWGDALYGHTLSPIQPMIDPLFGGKTALELIARLSGFHTRDPYEITRDSFRNLTHQGQIPGGDARFEARWREYLHTGVARLSPAAESAASEDIEPPQALAPAAENSPVNADRLEICFAASPSVYDGRFANNGWLQECPDPITKLTWDNAAILSPATADHLAVKTGDVVAITLNERRIEIPVLIMPGSADFSIQLPLGYGRTRAGALGVYAGVDVYPLRTSIAPWFVSGASVTRTGRQHALATTQDHWSIATHEVVDDVLKDRAIVREASREHFEHHPDFAQHMGVHMPHQENIHTAPPFTGEHQWGMVIDLNKCIGCNACAVACQAENNIPIVGKDEVIRGREMNWMRVDRYFRGDDPSGDVDVSVQPMLCQHCENAPCEPVCPVNATVHDSDGLNVMVYNRCIGTRYCANNCPYKVRRFNFYDYNKATLRTGEAGFDGDPTPNPSKGLSLPQFAQPPMEELQKMQKNPDVTVRMRGVMEKCTFCVQRIQRSKIDMKVQAGQTRADKVPDGQLRTACQQACPSEAIVFGDLADPDSRVSRWRAQPRHYAVLEHLNVRPRTTYLARLRNVNPRLIGEAREPHGAV